MYTSLTATIYFQCLVPNASIEDSSCNLLRPVVYFPIRNFISQRLCLVLHMLSEGAINMCPTSKPANGSCHIEPPVRLYEARSPCCFCSFMRIIKNISTHLFGIFCTIVESAIILRLGRELCMLSEDAIIAQPPRVHLQPLLHWPTRRGGLYRSYESQLSNSYCGR